VLLHNAYACVIDNELLNLLIMKRKVAIGETGSFRYVGVKPSVDESVSKQIVGELVIPRWLSPWNGHHDKCVNGQTHTEFSIDVGDAIDLFGDEFVDGETLKIAKQIAELLRLQGDKIQFSQEVVPIDFQTPLFGKEQTG
jgi:hypothetical protein